MSRGVLWLVWKGHTDPTALLERSRASVKQHHPDLPQHVEWLPDGSTLLDKARMADLSPFEETLFLDADTVVLGHLDFGFAKALRHGIACCINVNPWARRYPSMRSRDGGDTTEYDTGVLFFNKSHAGAMDVMAGWKRRVGMDSSVHFIGPEGLRVMPHNDQCAFAASVADHDFCPYVLPANFNVHPRWQKTIFGPVKVWHDYRGVPEPVYRWNERQAPADAVIECGMLS